MNRHYTTEDYLRRCEILRKYFKRPAITTDVIVGFPGETEDVFKYSRRAGTKAAAMPDQIPEQIKGVRSDRLLALEQKMSEEFRKGFIGEKVSVLFEESISSSFFLSSGRISRYSPSARPSRYRFIIRTLFNVTTL